MPQRITLERFSYAPDGTFGRMRLPTGEALFTVERPWLGNDRGESCIPDGVYDLKKRFSPVVNRTSGGQFSEGWEVTAVPNRTYIMVHPGNWPHNFEGCIGVGLDYGILKNKCGVSHSREAFRTFMAALEGQETWQLDIYPFYMEYP